jgi:hypothetical protein
MLHLFAISHLFFFSGHFGLKPILANRSLKLKGRENFPALRFGVLTRVYFVSKSHFCLTGAKILLLLFHCRKKGLTQKKKVQDQTDTDLARDLHPCQQNLCPSLAAAPATSRPACSTVILTGSTTTLANSVRALRLYNHR